MNTEILKVVKDLRSDLFYQIESKFGAEKASKYPSIIDADKLINKLTIPVVVGQSEQFSLADMEKAYKAGSSAEFSHPWQTFNEWLKSQR